MKILIKHPDGSETTLFERGDRARYTGNADWFCNTGEIGTVLGYHDVSHPPTSITHLRFQPDSARDGGYGTMRACPWHLEYIPPEEKPTE
jgi:hypothetical protein